MNSRPARLTEPMSNPRLPRRRAGCRRRIFGRGFYCVLVGCIALASGWPALAAPPTIDDAAERCFARVEYPAVDAKLAGEIADARVYFRAEQFEEFFYVKMVQQAGQWIGVLPVPSADTERVSFYIQAVARSLDDARSSDYSVPVVEKEKECDEQRILGMVPEVYDAAGNLVPGLPGFQAAGAAAAAGGGLGAGEIIGIAAGGALGGTAVVEAIDDDDQEPEEPASPSGP